MTEKKQTTCQEASRIGGQARKKEMPPGGYEALGRKGGGETLRRHGFEHYARAGAKGRASRAAKAAAERKDDAAVGD